MLIQFLKISRILSRDRFFSHRNGVLAKRVETRLHVESAGCEMSRQAVSECMCYVHGDMK